MLWGPGCLFSVFFSDSEAHVASSVIREAAGEGPTYISASSTFGSWPRLAETRSSVVRCIWMLHEEVLAAGASSKILQLYTTPQDVAMAPGPQEPRGGGKSSGAACYAGWRTITPIY